MRFLYQILSIFILMSSVAFPVAGAASEAIATNQKTKKQPKKIVFGSAWRTVSQHVYLPAADDSKSIALPLAQPQQKKVVTPIAPPSQIESSAQINESFLSNLKSVLNEEDDDYDDEYEELGPNEAMELAMSMTPEEEANFAAFLYNALQSSAR